MTEKDAIDKIDIILNMAIKPEKKLRMIRAIIRELEIND